MFAGDRLQLSSIICVIGLGLAAAQLPFSSVLVSVLFAVCAIDVAFRFAPADRLPTSLAAATDLAGGIAAAFLFATSPSAGIGVLLYVTTIYVGARYPQRLSVPIATLIGLAVIAGLGADNAGNWWMALTVSLSVCAGIAGRVRRERTRALEQLVEQTKLTAQSEARSSALAERTRIARDLHDVLAHTLSGAGMQLELADALLEADKPGDARAALQRARAAIADGVAEARDAVHALREDTVHLTEALTSMAEGENEHVEIEAVSLDDEQSRAVLRIAQEAITNARRHSPGADVTISLRQTDAGSELSVINKAGNLRTGVAGSGMGLLGMRERAAEVGGTLHAGPTADGGWSVHLAFAEATA